MQEAAFFAACIVDFMTLRFLRIPAAIVFGTALLSSSVVAGAQNMAPQSPYGGTTVEDIIARVNDQIITRSDYERAMSEVDRDARQRGATTMQEVAAAHKDLLRNLIDQQLWISKGKQMGINGETELVKRLDEIRKQYNLKSMEDLESAAKEQGVSFEDFKQNIRNGIITQEVMRQEVGQSIRFTPGEAERFYDEHKQDYAQPESVHLSEILISTGGATEGEKLTAAKAKVDDIEARLHAGGDFTQLAKSFSEGPTAAQGGELGQYQPGALPKLLEDKTFPLQVGQYTEPILTRQGYIILKVDDHIKGGYKPYKEVEAQVQDSFYMSRMEPAIRQYLTKLREESFIDIKPGYNDTGASPNETKPVFSAYTPPAPKKKAKVERTRFRETTHTFRQKSPEPVSDTAPAPVPAAAPPAPKPASRTAPATQAASAAKPASKSMLQKLHLKKSDKATEQANSEKPGKREKIRFGQAPRKTLPAAPSTAVEDAGALPAETAAAAPEPENPLEAVPVEVKTRYSARARVAKKTKQADAAAAKTDTLAPAAPDSGEVADRSTQSGPLGLNGDTASKKKKPVTNGEKTRLSDKAKEPQSDQPKQAPQFTPLPAIQGAPAPAEHPTTTPPAPQPTVQPQPPAPPQ
jgi:peptidyl-prolyl cis-trans isomerase SurA